MTQTDSTRKNNRHDVTQESGFSRENDVSSTSSSQDHDGLKNLKFEMYEIYAKLYDFANTVDLKVQKVTEKQVKVEEEQQSLKQDRIRNIEVLGIFVSFFTFISVEVAILQSATTIYELASISIIFFGGLCLFTSLLIQISEFWIRGGHNFSLFKNNLLYASLIIVCIGVALTIYGGSVSTITGESQETVAEVSENEENTVLNEGQEKNSTTTENSDI